MAILTDGMPNQLLGMKIMISSLGKGEWVRRSWKERLFSWPWTPWRRLKWDKSAGEYVLEDGAIIKTADCLFVNPNTFEAIKRGIHGYNSTERR